MRHRLWPSLALLLIAIPLQAQERSIAERLGHPAGTKLLILHGDDVGVAHSVNVASMQGLDRGAINSASIMMPTPWVTEIAAYARSHPDADLGLHLTLTSEWDVYRWGGVASRDQVPSLYAADGTFPNAVAPVAANAKIDEVERELRAQVEYAMKLGIRPTHLDSHMGALFSTPALAAVYVKVAHAYKLPFLAVKGETLGLPNVALAPNDIVLNDVIVAGPQVPRDKWKQFYLDAIANLKPGVSEIIVHLGHDDAELQAVTVNQEPYGSAWRQQDVNVMSSPEIKQALKEHGVVLVTWRELGKAAQMK